MFDIRFAWCSLFDMVMYSFIKKFFQIVILSIASVGISILMSFISKKGTDFSLMYVDEPLSNCTLAASEDAPYHAWIEFDGGYMCSGALIHKQYVLTVAHYVIKTIKNDTYKTKMKVFLGTRTIPEGTPYGVDRITCHDSYDPGNFKDDIALVKLAEKVSLALDIRPIRLPTKTQSVHEGLKLVASGYARLDFRPRRGKVDQHKFPMRVVSSETCQKLNEANLELSGKFCAIADYGYHHCLSDGGSPATVRRRYLVGLYIRSNSCSYKHAEFFVNVSSYIAFIESAMDKQV